MNVNLIGQLFDLVDTSLDQNIAYVVDNQSVSYAELRNHSFCAAGYFYDRGIRPGQVVAMCCDDSLLWPPAWFGLILLGAIPLNIPPLSQINVLQDILDDSCANAVLLDKADSTVPQTQFVLDRAVIEYSSPLPHEHIYNHEADDEIFFLLSSGTSGKRKIISHSRRDLFNSFVNTPNPYGLNSSSQIYCGVKLSTSWGMLLGLLGNLALRYTVVLSDIDRDFLHIDQTLQQHNITHLMLVPKTLSFIHNNCNKLPNTVDRIYVTGEFCSSDLIDKTQQKFKIPVLDCYGSGEVRCWVVLTNFDNDQKIGSLGKPGPGVQLALTQPDGMPAKVGEIGKLSINHPNVFNGYKNDAIGCCLSNQDCWYHTQDYMRIDTSGYYFYVGRESDMINSNISLLEIESKIAKIIQSNDVVVIANNNQITACLLQGSITTAQTDHVNDLVDKILFVSEIPVTLGTSKKSRNFKELTQYAV